MANPILTKALSESTLTTTTHMSIQGVVKKTAFLLTLTAFVGVAFFFFALFSGISYQLISGMSYASIFAGLILSLVIMFKPHLGKALAIPYAIVEGLVIGAISFFVTLQFPTVAVSAMSATFITAGVMLVLYKTQVIRVTEKFRSIIISAVLAISLVYLVQLGFRLFAHSSIPYLFDGGVTAIAFSAFVVVIASFSLLVDFDNVERAYRAGLSEDYEWVLSIGILSTLVWMYIEFLRLLRNLQD